MPAIEDYRKPGRPHLEVLIKELFEPARLLDYLGHCVAFEEDDRIRDVVRQ